jgi:hypothetical protein
MNNQVYWSSIFTMDEGIIQGDALGPIYCQLLTSVLLCKPVREQMPLLAQLASYFDDLTALGEASQTIEAMMKIKELLPLVNGELNLKKCKLFSSHPLPRKGP